MHSMSNLTQRLIVGSFSTVVMFLAIYLSFDSYFRPFFVLLIAVIVGTALWEFYAVATAIQAPSLRPLSKYAIFCSAIYIVATFLATPSVALLSSTAPQFVLLFTLATLFGYFCITDLQPFVNIAVTLFGMIYLTLPLAFLISINYFFPQDSLQDGRLWLIYLLLVTKMTDIGAYICGKNLGSTKITPYISPSKTLEGAVGGIVAATLTSALVCTVVHPFISMPSLSLATSLWLGALLGIVAEFGDLAESLLKREGNVKDSNQLPGLGGVLDVVDSLVFTAPLLYFFLQNIHLFL